MIVTKTWLNEWINLKDISSEDICVKLNAIGLEVDSLNKISIPKNIVVAKVLTCKKHPDADKLNVCEVDLGNEVKQIVCGAKNVRAGQYVVVSKVGAILPNGMEIKEAKLRGLDSFGMICSSTEIGLPAMENGIMVIDDSIGELILGKEFSEYPLVNDEIIEIELTANRGDCLSVYGVARDLSVPYDLDLNKFSSQDEENQLGIGRILNVTASENVNASLIYRAFEKEELNSSFLIDLRLAFAGIYKEILLERLLEYATYTSGVLLRAYAKDSFIIANEKINIKIKKHSNELDAVYGKNSQVNSFVGICQNSDSFPSEKDRKIIVEANYTHPEIISTCSANKKLDSDRHLYRSSRGSEPDLEFGMSYFVELLKKYSKINLYAGCQEILQDFEEVIIPVDLNILAEIIGEEIPKNRIIQILKRLGFDVVFKSEQSTLNVKVPRFRHDILNIQDVCEEIVRIVGIDNITSKPLIFAEKDKNNDSYTKFKKRQFFRYKAVGVGFFETLHFVFDNKERMQKYGLITVYKKREIANPITNELNTLRTSLIPNMLESASRNVKFGKKSIRLFEVGTVFNKSRDESTYIGFIFSGDSESEKVTNHGKPSNIDFFTFAQKISQVIGDIKLETTTCKDKLCNPYEYAKVLKDGVELGYIGRVHLNVEKELDLFKTYACELDMSKLPSEKVEVIESSKFQSSIRDLSLMVPKNMVFSTLKNHILENAPKELVKLYPIDVYEDESFGEHMSLTIKLQFQSNEKTLEEEDIVGFVDNILNSLKEKFGISIR